MTLNETKTRQEYSSGGVVYKKWIAESGKWRALFLLGKHSGYHKWVLPKGMIEEGETASQTAVRETEEEMGIVARIIGEKPIHEIHYSYYAEMKTVESKSLQQDNNSTIQQTDNVRANGIRPAKVQSQQTVNPKTDLSTRRVKKYQEDGDLEDKVKVEKIVTFYLMEYVSGSEQDHGWEMETVEWFSYDEAMEKLAFDSEKEALIKGFKSLKKTFT